MANISTIPYISSPPSKEFGSFSLLVSFQCGTRTQIVYHLLVRYERPMLGICNRSVISTCQAGHIQSQHILDMLQKVDASGQSNSA